MVTVGGIDQKVRQLEGQFCVREMLSLTLSLDHDMIDGSPAARFAAAESADRSGVRLGGTGNSIDGRINDWLTVVYFMRNGENQLSPFFIWVWG